MLSRVWWPRGSSPDEVLQPRKPLHRLTSAHRCYGERQQPVPAMRADTARNWAFWVVSDSDSSTCCLAWVMLGKSQKDCLVGRGSDGKTAPGIDCHFDWQTMTSAVVATCCWIAEDREGLLAGCLQHVHAVEQPWRVCIRGKGTAQEPYLWQLAICLTGEGYWRRLTSPAWLQPACLSLTASICKLPHTHLE